MSVPSGAQPSAVLEARTMLESGSTSTCAFGMVNDVALHVPGAHLAVVTAPVTDGLRPRLPPAIVAFDVARSVNRAWQVRAAGAVGASASRCASQSQWTRGWVQLARAIPRGGVALGVGARSVSTLDPSRDRQGVTVAVWQQRGASRLAVDVRSFVSQSRRLNRFTYLVQRPDSIRNDTAQGGWIRFTRPVEAPDSAIATQRSQSIAVRTSWQRRIGSAALDLSAGAIGDLGGSSSTTRDSTTRATINGWSRLQPWVRADARIRLRSWADVLLGIAALPSMPDSREVLSTSVQTTRTRTNQVFSIGVSLAARNASTVASDSSTPSDPHDAPATLVAFEALRIDDAADGPTTADSVPQAPANARDDDDRVPVLVRLRDPGARTVDVSGEPFGWRAVPLRRTSGGWWEARVRLRPGTWRMSVRRDGRRWTAPPGLPALQDEFGGEVALVTIR